MVSKNVVKVDEKYWHRFFRISGHSEEGKPITGKYLFFSESKEELERIAIEELEVGGFPQAKVPTEKNKIGSDYVLCLYFWDDSRKKELALKYRDNDKVQYRYWKSDEATIEGKYSREFLGELPAAERKKRVSKA